MTDADELLDLGPRRQLPRLPRPHVSLRTVRNVLGSLTGAGAVVATAAILFAPPVVDGHGTNHVPPRPVIVQPLKGDFLK